MKIYVSTTSKRLDLARQAMDAIRARGWTVTLDWTEEIESESRMSDSELSRRAIADIQAIQEADAVLLICCPEMRSVGAMVEVGAAIGMGRPVVVASIEGATFDHLFARHPLVSNVNGNVETCLDEIEEWRQYEEKYKFVAIGTKLGLF